MSDVLVPGGATAVARAPRPSDRRQSLRRMAGPLLALAFALLFPALVAGDVYWLLIGTQVAIFMLVAFGVNVLFGFGGVPFLGQGALMGIGAYTTAILMVDHGWSFFLAAAVALPIVLIFGVAFALPSLRVSAWYFALVSLTLNQVFGGLVTEWSFTGGNNGIVGVQLPEIGSYQLTGTDLYYVMVALNVIAFLVVANVARSRFGRALAALREGDASASTIGAEPVRLRLMAFVFCAITCSVAGSMLAVANQVVTAPDFSATVSIFFLVAVVVGGAGRIWGPVIGVIVFYALPEVFTALASYQMLVYGIALLILMVFAPKGLIGVAENLWTLLRKRTGHVSAKQAEIDAAVAAAVEEESTLHAPIGAAAMPELVVELPESLRRGADEIPAAIAVRDVSKAFGGVRVLEDLSFDVEGGSIFAIIGPNGSGKTTTLNVISGLYAADGGRVEIDGEDLTGAPSHRVARAGIARTFQTPRILEQIDGLDNVLLGAYRRERASSLEVLTNLGRASRERRQLRQEARDLLAMLGADDVAEVVGDSIPHGKRRLVEVARAIMLRPKVLLLDEPAAGLSPLEIEQLMAAIRAAKRAGITVVLIEHHVDMVVAVADRAAVIDRGRILAVGAPDEVLRQPEVTVAYMGE